VGGTDYQSDFVVGFQPHLRFTVPASFLSKQFFRLEDNLIPYDEVCCPGQFVRKGTVGDHGIGLLHLAIVVGSRLRIIAPRQLSSLQKGPAQVFVAVFLVSSCLFLSIVRTHDVLNRYLEIQLAKHNSSPTTFAVMNALIVHGGTMTPTAISKWIFRPKHTITSMLHALEDIGYTKRKTNQHDARSVNIIITKKGWEATEKMIPIAEEMGQRAISCFDSDQLETLLSL